MGSLKEIRTRINSVQSTQQITKAMKMVAAAKLRKAQDAIQKMRPYARKLHDLTEHLSESIEESEIYKTYFEQRPVQRVLLVVVTGDKGLCGAFNNNVQKLTMNTIKERYPQLQKDGKVDLFCIGKKGYEFLKKRPYNIVEGYTEFFNNPDYNNSVAVAEKIMGWYEKGEYDRVEVIYNWFKNAATYFSTTQQFLPIASLNAAGDQPKRKKGEQPKVESKYNHDYIFEPSKEGIIQELIPKALTITFFKDILDSNAAEHGSRMTAMDNATENAQELIEDLKLQYNKERQAAITKEISEIVGGAEALAES